MLMQTSCSLKRCESFSRSVLLTAAIWSCFVYNFIDYTGTAFGSLPRARLCLCLNVINRFSVVVVVFFSSSDSINKCVLPLFRSLATADVCSCSWLCRKLQPIINCGCLLNWHNYFANKIRQSWQIARVLPISVHSHENYNNNNNNEHYIEQPVQFDFAPI